MSARTLSAIPTHIVNICGKLHQNPSTNYRDLASSKIGDNGHTMYGQPDGRLKTECLSLSNVGSRGVSQLKVSKSYSQTTTFLWPMVYKTK